METTIKERLLAYLNYKGISQYRFQKTIGASNGYINGIKNSIHADFLIRISSNYPDLNVQWLLKGTGEMLADENTKPILTIGGNNGNVIENSTSNGDMVQISNCHDPNNTNNANLYEQLLELKDFIATIKAKVFRASKCPTIEECREILDDILLDEHKKSMTRNYQHS